MKCNILSRISGDVLTAVYDVVWLSLTNILQIKHAFLHQLWIDMLYID